MPGTIRSMNLEHVLRDVQTDRANLLHGRLLSVAVRHRHLGTQMPSGGVHPITQLSRSRRVLRMVGVGALAVDALTAVARTEVSWHSQVSRCPKDVLTRCRSVAATRL